MPDFLCFIPYLPLIPLICFVETRQAIRVADHPREQMPLDRCASPSIELEFGDVKLRIGGLSGRESMNAVI